MKIYFYLLLLALSHCSPKKIPKNTLVVALDSEVKNLDPRKATDANGMRIVGLIFNGLVQIGPKLQIQPDGAKKWLQQDLTYTFYLKPLYFSNGRKVTKEDISFSFKEFMSPSSPFSSAFKNIESVQVRNQNQALIVQIKMKKFQATFLSSDLPVIKILPKKEIQENPNQFFKHPLGTGTFKVIHKNSRETLLERVKHQDSLPQYLSFQIIRDSFTRTQKTLTGKIDIAPSVIPLDKLQQFSKDQFQILKQPSLSTTYLLLNLNNPLLKQKNVRKIIQLSVNKNEIIKYRLKNYGIPARSLIQPKNIFFNSKLKHVIPDLNLAQRLAKKYQLKMKPLILTTTNNRDSQNRARILSGQISQSGLKIRTESYEWGTFYKDINKGRYDLALMKWVGITDPDIYRIAFHSQNQAPQGRNRSFYKNKKVDQLLERGLTLKSFSERKKMYDRVQKIIAKDLAIMPLWHDVEVTVIKRNVKNYFLPMNGDFSPLKQATKTR